ncbi:hypothetical protein OUZ56_000705 [Daphnia magna]|uniref:Uncharacterized protein n=1 Tax=Daphnia magna TaxID=35525 RepID=A0ABR0A0I7_9CRUS|nr:hypothetical protein OUZ56_000705 [Daphnia magna]
MDGQQEYKQCLLETRHGQLLRPQLFALLHAYIVHKRLLISDCVTMIHPSFSPFAYIHARTYTQSHKGLMKSKGIQKPTKLEKASSDAEAGKLLDSVHVKSQDFALPTRWCPAASRAASATLHFIVSVRVY